MVGELVERQLYLVCSSGVDSVYTEIVPDATKRTLQAIIRGKADIASIIHTDRWRGYDGLVDVCFDKHLRVNHGNNEFARGCVHVNGIESFWSYAKRRMVQFNGVPPARNPLEEVLPDFPACPIAKRRRLNWPRGAGAGACGVTDAGRVNAPAIP